MRQQPLFYVFVHGLLVCVRRFLAPAVPAVRTAPEALSSNEHHCARHAGVYPCHATWSQRSRNGGSATQMWRSR